MRRWLQFLTLCICLLAAASVSRAADTVNLRFGGSREAVRYAVHTDAVQRTSAGVFRLSADYEAWWQPLKPVPSGQTPVLVTLGPGKGTVTGDAGATRLSWNYTGRSLVPLWSLESLIVDMLLELPEPAGGGSMDALAAYFLAGWSIVLPGRPVAPGETWVVDVADEPSPTGKVLTTRRVVGTLERVGEVAGRRVAYVSGEMDQRTVPDHPTLRGSASVRVDSAFELDGGRLLASRIVETSDVTVAAGASQGTSVRTDPLECTIRIPDGPAVDPVIRGAEGGRS
jgi:hypothetical protein